MDGQQMIRISEATMLATTALRIAVAVGGDLRQILEDIRRDEALPEDARAQAAEAVRAAENAWRKAKQGGGNGGV